MAADAFAPGEGPSLTFSVQDPHRQIDYIMYRSGFRASGPTRVLREVTVAIISLATTLLL